MSITQQLNAYADSITTPKRKPRIIRPKRFGHRYGDGTVNEERRNKRFKYHPNRLADRVEYDHAQLQYPEMPSIALPLPPKRVVIHKGYGEHSGNPSTATPIGHRAIRDKMNQFSRDKALRGNANLKVKPIKPTIKVL